MKLEKRNQLRSGVACAVLALAMIGPGCGKKKNDSGTDDSGNGEKISISGKLQLAEQLAMDVSSARQVLYFTLLGGQVMDAPQKVDVNSDGSFQVSVAARNEKLVAAQNAVGQTPVDKGPLKAAFPEYAGYIDQMTDEQIKSELASMLARMAAQGGPQYIMVSYVPSGSGDALAEAQSFQFIGMPTGGRNMLTIPADSAKGDIQFGTIVSGAGDDATAELRADTNVFNLSADSISQLASLGQTLKVVKNYWVNKSDDGKSVRVEAQPFFLWTGLFSSFASGASPATAPSYTGYGMYVRVTSADDLVFDSFCPQSSGMTPGTPTQELAVLPPSGASVVTKVGGSNVTITSASPFNNHQTSQQQQSGKTVCNGSATGFYARNDSPGQYMFNWGTGGSIQGQVPAGFWTYKELGTARGYFDISAGSPVDTDGKAKVLVPRLTVSRSGGNVTAVRASFALYNPVTGSYDDVSDVGVFKKVASQVMISLSIGNGSGQDERYGAVDQEGGDLTVRWDGSAITTDIPAQYQAALWGGSGSTNGMITGIAAGYVIGGSTYRFEFQDAL